MMCEFDKDQTVNEEITLNLVFFLFFPLFIGFSVQNGLQIWNLEAKIHQLKKKTFFICG